MSKPIVIALGEILWDMLPTGKRAGGAPVNFAYHASQNGAESYAISAVTTSWAPSCSTMRTRPASTRWCRPTNTRPAPSPWH